ncbi:putative geranylgeranylglyceryl/ heptaprenylglyceryl phosphate synthase [Paenibacillus agaridevorans]|uniref:Putative geranylgeranylglyceryl/ heptaprenylglyceryl phosphate synthase n=2 Tax=Paenibacillus agaridevorans TaxID=171404 RepID=A0A2R5ETW1_9BACL|nr:putative geranylgeranylglyceryl/ heptaprenylglyceryl phosphate synthase [Paenibacillus agaridevorans]
MDGAVPGFDGYFVPIVLNTDRSEWILGNQIEGLKEYGTFVPWEETAAQGYIILNENATAAKLTGAKTELEVDELIAHIRMGVQLMRVPLIYIEYSGRFGDMELLRSARRAIGSARLFYGGGIDSAEKARLAGEHAHTVVVGNIVYSDLAAALSTVAAVYK